MGLGSSPASRKDGRPSIWLLLVLSGLGLGLAATLLAQTLAFAPSAPRAPTTLNPQVNPESATPYNRTAVVPKLNTPVAAATTPAVLLPRVPLPRRAARTEAGLRFGAWQQAGAKLEAAQVAQLPDRLFRRSAHNKLGVSRHPVWVRLRLEAAASAPGLFILELGRPAWSEARAYLVIGAEHGGPSPGIEPMALQRLSHLRHTAFELPRLTSPTTVLLKLAQDEAIAPVLQFWSPEAYEAEAHHDALVQGLLLGLLLGLMLYNGALYLTSRDPAYAAYVLWQSATVLYLLSVTGLGLLYLWPEQQALQAMLPLVSSLLMSAGALYFVRVYLLLAQRLPRMDLVLALLQWFSLTLAAVRVLPGTASLLLPSLLLIAVSVVGITVAAVMRTRNHFVPAGILLLSCTLTLASGFASLGRSAGLLAENFWTTDAFEWVAILLALLLSFGLSIRVGQMRERTLRLQAMSMLDPLTGLCNRSGLFEAGGRVLERSRRSRSLLAVLWLDLDGLKRINDRFGHAAGDALIQEAARRIRTAAGPDAVCARLGGDEFAVLLPNLPASHLAGDSARHLLACLRQPYNLQGQELRATASIGIAIDEPGVAHSLETLLLRADVAMYRAKAHGRDIHVTWQDDAEDMEQAAQFQFTRPAL